jgi:hypothetical protein
MKKLIPLLVILLLLAVAVPVAAKAHERIGDQINVLIGTPTTFAVGDPFHIAHGWLLAPEEKPVSAFRFQLEVDGVVREPDFIERSAEGGAGGASHTLVWVYNFPEGLSGTHTFTGHWMGRCQVLVDLGYIPGPCVDPKAYVDHYSADLTVDFTVP